MKTKHLIAIAALTLAISNTAFGQWHPEIDRVKNAKPKTQSIELPRDVATGQATGKRQHKPYAKFANGLVLNEPVKEVVAGQNSGGTITNQRSKQSGSQNKNYRKGGVTHEDSWNYPAQRKPRNRK